jgi:hypothetical protein
MLIVFLFNNNGVLHEVTWDNSRGLNSHQRNANEKFEAEIASESYLAILQGKKFFE